MIQTIIWSNVPLQWLPLLPQATKLGRISWRGCRCPCSKAYAIFWAVTWWPAGTKCFPLSISKLPFWGSKGPIPLKSVCSRWSEHPVRGRIIMLFTHQVSFRERPGVKLGTLTHIVPLNICEFIKDLELSITMANSQIFNYNEIVHCQSPWMRTWKTIR